MASEMDNLDWNAPLHNSSVSCIDPKILQIDYSSSSSDEPSYWQDFNPVWPQSVVWLFKVPEKPRHNNPFTKGDVTISEDGEKLADLVKKGLDCIDAANSAAAIKKYNALRPDLQRILIHKEWKDWENRTKRCWNIAAIECCFRKRRVKPDESANGVQQIQETKAIYVLMVQEASRKSPLSIFSNMRDYTEAEIDLLEWDVPSDPRKPTRDLAQCLVCAHKKIRCDEDERCAECTKQSIPCIRGKIWEWNVFDYDPEPSITPSIPTPGTRKRKWSDLTKPNPELDLLRYIEHMPRDKNLPNALAQLDRIYRHICDRMFDAHLLELEASVHRREAQELVFQDRGPLYLLIETNFILTNACWIKGGLDPCRRGYIQALRTHAGEAVLLELKGLCNRDRMAAIKKNVPWSYDMLTYLMLTLKAILDFGDTVGEISPRATEVCEQIPRLQQAICYFIRNLIISLFGTDSPLSKEFNAVDNGDCIYERTWLLLREERQQLATRLKVTFETHGHNESFHKHLSDLSHQGTYAAQSQRLSKSIKKQQKSTKKRTKKDLKTSSRLQSTQANLHKIFDKWHPFRPKIEPFDEVSFLEVTSLGGDPVRRPQEGEPENGQDMLNHYLHSASDGVPGVTLLNGTRRAVPYRYPNETKVVIAKTEHAWYRQAGASGQVLTMKEAYLHCDCCNKLCAVENGEVIYMCQEKLCAFSVGWFYCLVDKEGHQFMGDASQSGMRPGLVLSGRFKRFDPTISQTAT